MIIFSALELLLAVVLIAFFVLQVLRPLVRGTRLFPMFSRRTKLSDEMVQLREEEELIELEKQVEAKRREIARIKTEKEKGE